MQIAIVLYPGFTALDFIGPYESLHYLPDAEVRFLWHEPGPITADSGVLTVGATHSLMVTEAGPEISTAPGAGFGGKCAARYEEMVSSSAFGSATIVAIRSCQPSFEYSHEPAIRFTP